MIISLYVIVIFLHFLLVYIFFKARLYVTKYYFSEINSYTKQLSSISDDIDKHPFNNTTGFLRLNSFGNYEREYPDGGYKSDPRNSDIYKLQVEISRMERNRNFIQSNFYWLYLVPITASFLYCLITFSQLIKN